jgi:hypothetical protein
MMLVAMLTKIPTVLAMWPACSVHEQDVAGSTERYTAPEERQWELVEAFVAEESHDL